DLALPIPQYIAVHPLGGIFRRVLSKKTHTRAGNAAELYQEVKTINFAALVSPPAQTAPVHLALEALETPTVIDPWGPAITGQRQRKQITVLALRFELGAQILDQDVEIIDTLLRDQKYQCTDIIERYCGFFSGSLSNLVLAYFGHPQATDNDARLCARAALDIVGHIRQCQLPGANIRAHIGIHTGLVISTNQEAELDGICVDTAVQLSFAAPANSIQCSHATYQMLSMHLDFTHQNQCYFLSGERQVEAFGFLRSHQSSHELVGRKEELAHVQHFLAQPTPSYLHIHGEAGIGKSRLVFEVRSNAQAYQHYIAQCLPEHQYSGLYPILRLVQLESQILNTTAAQAVQQLRARLERMNLPANALTLLCIWLNLPLPTEQPASIEALEEQKQTLFKTLYALLHGSATEPTAKLFIIEDLHWADPLTLEFLAYSHSQSGSLASPHKWIGTSRTAFPIEAACSQRQTLAINKLTPHQIQLLVSILLERQTLSLRLIDLIIERTDGVPLYVEELTRMLERKGLIYRLNGIVDLTSPQAIEQVPSSLKDSLQQKLDYLSMSKETAQLAAVIGRTFGYTLLLQASPHPEEKVQQDLKELISQDLIVLQRHVHGDRYIFKHALVRDAAYESIPSPQRKLLHHKVAQCLEASEESIDNTILAQHWAKAGDFVKASHYTIAQANEALKRSSASEAIVLAQQLEQWAANIPDATRSEHQLATYRLFTTAYMESKGWASDEVKHYTEASIAILKQQNKAEEIVPQLWWKVLGGVVAGARAPLAPTIAEMDLIFDSVNAINKSAIRCAQGFYYFAEGRRDKCISCFKDSIACYDSSIDIAHQQTFGFDVAVFAKATLGRTYVDMNEQALAIQNVTQAVQEARSHNNIPSLGIALMYYAIVFQQYGNKPQVQQAAGELLALAEKHDMVVYHLYGQMLYDWAVGTTENAAEILQKLTEMGSFFAVGQFQSFYADTLIENQYYKEAIFLIERCLTINNEHNEHFYTPHLLSRQLYCLAATDAGSKQIQLVETALTERLKETPVPFLNLQ
ncbi:MAG TPA: AAA family ATPase, partial [Marinagarivorans sp.]|nr:AAA family ATPase [Marinagarivorans sp.]